MAIFDLDSILEPISEESPCGAARDSDDINYLNLAAELQQMGDLARKIERAKAEFELMPSEFRESILRESAGRSNDPKGDPKWRDISSLAVEILSAHSKDTIALSWLIESSVRAYGIEGLAEALVIGTRLLETYSNQLHPHDPDDPVNAVGFIYRLTASDIFLDGIRRAEVNIDVPISYDSFRLANHLDKISENDRRDLLDTGLQTNDELEALVTSNQQKVLDYLVTLQACLDATELLSDVLEELSASGGYNASKLKQQLSQIQSQFASFGISMPSPTEILVVDEPDSSPQTNMVATSPARGFKVEGVLETREDALKSLLQVAAYFRKTEPHSPLSYSLEQAVRWARMPLPSLLEELIEDQQVLSQVYQRMGIQREDE